MWKVNILIGGFKLEEFFFINKQLTICKLKQNFVFPLLKLILKHFSAGPKLLLIPKAGPPPNTHLILLLYHNFLLYWLLQISNFEILSCQQNILAIHLNRSHCKYLKCWSSNCFVPQLKDLYKMLFIFYIQKFVSYEGKQYIMA